ncbi:hypothetical protein ABK040_011549 [Willaertia magna]
MGMKDDNKIIDGNEEDTPIITPVPLHATIKRSSFVLRDGPLVIKGIPSINTSNLSSTGSRYNSPVRQRGSSSPTTSHFPFKNIEQETPVSNYTGERRNSKKESPYSSPNNSPRKIGSPVLTPSNLIPNVSSSQKTEYDLKYINLRDFKIKYSICILIVTILVILGLIYSFTFSIRHSNNLNNINKEEEEEQNKGWLWFSEDKVTICPWFKDKKGAISFTFDRGYESQLTFSSLFKSKHIPATFFISPSLFGSFDWESVKHLEDKEDENEKARKILHDTFKEDKKKIDILKRIIHESYHEIGSHGMYGIEFREKLISKPAWYRTDNDFKDVRTWFIEKVNLNPAFDLSFSWPNGFHQFSHEQVAHNHYVASRSMEFGTNKKNPVRLSIVKSIEMNFSHLSSLDKFLQQTTEKGEWMVLHNSKGIDFCKNSQQCETGKNPEDAKTIEQYLTKINEERNDLFIDTFGNVARYIRQRESTKVKKYGWKQSLFFIELEYKKGANTWSTPAVPLTLKVNFKSMDYMTSATNAKVSSYIIDSNGNEIAVQIPLISIDTSVQNSGLLYLHVTPCTKCIGFGRQIIYLQF